MIQFKTKKVFTGLLIFLAALLCFNAFSQIRIEPYNFPVKPSSNEWSSLISYEDKRKACQIPEPILKSFTTDALIETYLAYPLLGDLMVFHTPQEGFNKLKINFNGVNELLLRKDIGVELMKKYNSMKALLLEGLPNFSRGEYSFKIQAIEILFSQMEILLTLNATERKELMQTVINHLADKQTNYELYGLNAQYISGWLIVRILKLENYRFELLIDKDHQSLFIDDGLNPEQNLIQDILAYGKSFLSKK
jgi:hypothetical protein